MGIAVAKARWLKYRQIVRRFKLWGKFIIHLVLEIFIARRDMLFYEQGPTKTLYDHFAKNLPHYILSPQNMLAKHISTFKNQRELLGSTENLVVTRYAVKFE